MKQNGKPQNWNQVLTLIHAFDLPRFIEDNYGIDLRNDRSKYLINALWRGDNNPSFSLYKHTHKRKWLFHDFATGEKGDSLDFLTNIMNLDMGTSINTLEFGNPHLALPYKKSSNKTKKQNPFTGKRNLIRTHHYQDENGIVVFEKRKYDNGDYTSRRKYKSYWVYGINAGRYSKKDNFYIPDASGELYLREYIPPLYNLPEILKSNSIHLLDGEKDVDTIKLLGYCGSCGFAGRQQWDDSYTKILKGKTIFLWEDNERNATQTSKMLKEKLELKGIEVFGPFRTPLPYKDISDYYVEDAQNAIKLIKKINALSTHQ